MRILHVTSDWKWTGPAAPMLALVLAQRARGDDADLACPEAPAGTEASLAARAREAGAEPALAIRAARAVAPWRDVPDARRLRAHLDARSVDVIHAWHSRDHALALAAAARRRRAGTTVLVRSWRSADAAPARPWNRWLLGPATDGLLCVSPEAARRSEPLRGGRPVRGAFGAVDLERFRPAARDEGLRRELGLVPEHRVVGVVARVQRHRRFDLLLAAAAELFAADASARLLVVGRGTHLDALARRPAERLGIADRVVFAGYRTRDYADVLRCMDVLTFLVPGSDGGCRALLEAAACGLPAVTSRRGALPEIVAHGETGLAVDEDPRALALAWRELLADPARRVRLGAAARLRAERLFSPSRYAEEVGSLYADALRGRRAVPRPGPGR